MDGPIILIVKFEFMSKALRKALVLSHFNHGINRVFEDYCQGIRANVDEYYYLDYIDAYRDKGCKRFERDIEGVVITHGITHVFLIWWSCDLTFDVNFLARLARHAKLVMNFFDTEYFFEGVDRYYAQVADLVMLPDELSRYRFEHLGIPAHTSFALFDRYAYTADDTADHDISVSFVGNLKQADRAEYIEFLRQNGIKVESYGIGTNNGFVSFESMVRIFNRSRINLNFTSTTSIDNYAIDLPRINQRIRQSKGRPIEIALCGGFILSQHAPGIEHMFKPGEEFDIFHSKEELLAKVRYYLSHEEQRTEMANRAHQQALSRYDATAGFHLALASLDGQSRPTPTPLYFDKAFCRNYAAFRFFYIVMFLLERRFFQVIPELIIVMRVRSLDLVAAYHFATRGLLHFLREHPTIELFFKRIRRWIPLKLKY